MLSASLNKTLPSFVAPGVCQHDSGDAPRADRRHGVCRHREGGDDRDEGRRGAGLLVGHPQRRGGDHAAERGI